MPSFHVHGLDRFVDAIHAQFDAWMDDKAFNAAIGPDGLTVLRLAVHEWVANLVQHAEFCGPAELELGLSIVQGGIRCEIEDSSNGFDFLNQVGTQQSMLSGPAPSERGRGLLMLVSCAEDLEFRQAGGESSQRIAFTVGVPDDETLAGLFRPEDLAFDVTDEAFPIDDVEARGDGAAGAEAPLSIGPDPLSS